MRPAHSPSVATPRSVRTVTHLNLPSYRLFAPVRRHWTVSKKIHEYDITGQMRPRVRKGQRKIAMLTGTSSLGAAGFSWVKNEKTVQSSRQCPAAVLANSE